MLQSQLMEIARLTGGRAVFPGSMKELEPMYSSIAQRDSRAVPARLRAHQRRARRQVAEGGDRAEAAPVGPRVQIRTREGYFAPVK